MQPRATNFFSSITREDHSECLHALTSITICNSWMFPATIFHDANFMKTLLIERWINIITSFGVSVVITKKKSYSALSFMGFAYTMLCVTHQREFSSSARIVRAKGEGVYISIYIFEFICVVLTPQEWWFFSSVHLCHRASFINKLLPRREHSSNLSRSIHSQYLINVFKNNKVPRVAPDEYYLY